MIWNDEQCTSFPIIFLHEVKSSFSIFLLDICSFCFWIPFFSSSSSVLFFYSVHLCANIEVIYFSGGTRMPLTPLNGLLITICVVCCTNSIIVLNFILFNCPNICEWNIHEMFKLCARVWVFDSATSQRHFMQYHWNGHAKHTRHSAWRCKLDLCRI